MDPHRAMESPSRHVKDEEVSPEYEVKPAPESRLYHSGQAKLFNSDVAKQADAIP